VRTLASRVTAGVFYACVLFAFAAVVIGTVGILGVRSATSVGRGLTSDELATATITAQLGLQLDSVFATGQRLAFSDHPVQRARMAASLYDQQIPQVEAELASLKRVHEGDDATERADLGKLVEQWTVLRSVLNPGASTSTPGPHPGLAARIDAAYRPLSDHLTELIDREDVDARADQANADSKSARTVLGIVAAVALALLGSVGLGWAASRRLRRAVEPAENQAEFADTLQLAQDEDEAQHLLQRHLERAVTGGSVTVLNRNNSADRLEAVTDLPAESALVQSLARAEPGSCLAVRSGRSHDEDDHRPALLGCPICAQCPGRSTCTPLTVGGEVIGSVLVNRSNRYSVIERQQIRDSVGQAAPVLANLRNLAIAELRASMDSLTGLPNKRAVADTLKRMLAQASRTLSALSLVVLDLDHFKEINDRFGHPLGDQALANVGAAIRSALRESDFAGRNGGEEFAVLLPDTDATGAVVTAEKLRAAIADISLPGVDLPVTASVGIAAYPEHALSTERLERLADSALYIAKRSGRDRIEVAAPTDPSEVTVIAEPAAPAVE
jgi:diguanylate cyclase (GGDEF)-like protein